MEGGGGGGVCVIVAAFKPFMPFFDQDIRRFNKLETLHIYINKIIPFLMFLILHH